MFGIQEPSFNAWNRRLPRPPLSRGRWRHTDFAIGLEARHDGVPNRVHLRCGRVVPFRLLSTPPHGDAVTFRYERPNLPSTRTFTSRMLKHHRRTTHGPGGPGSPRMSCILTQQLSRDTSLTSGNRLKVLRLPVVDPTTTIHTAVL